MTAYRLSRTEYRYALLWLAAQWPHCGQPSAPVDSPTIQPEYAMTLREQEGQL